MVGEAAVDGKTNGGIRLGMILLEAGHIPAQDLENALKFQSQFGGRIGSILVRIGAVSEDVMLTCLSEQLGFPVIDGDNIPKGTTAFTSVIDDSDVDTDWWIDQEALVWRDDRGELNCIARDPLSAMVQEVVSRQANGAGVNWWLARNRDLDRALAGVREESARRTRDTNDEISHLRELAEEAPVVEFVSNTLAQAFGEGASDIHIEPGESNFEIRHRIDGVLQPRATVSRDRFDAVASRIKLISGLDIAERRLPQDGRLSTRISGHDIDIRVSTLPGVWGESIVLRLLPKERQDISLEGLGMEPDHLRIFRQWIREPHGIILVTGPTGSGKSTTLYGTLAEINDGESKIVTVEDPVEYNIPGITQVQAKAEIGYTFARALRSILRQDPDTVMIGEIRDLETAEIAVRAALTGHLVFSTLHTNDAISAFTRLVDMGLESFLVASSVNAIMAQRLVRKLCPECSEAHQPAKTITEIAGRLKKQNSSLFPGKKAGWRAPVGCHECRGTGYRGRMGIYEMVSVTPEIRDSVMNGASAHDLERIARTEGYRNLREDGLVKAWNGKTSVEEVIRVAGGADGDD